jgi:hypothetical protein
MVARRWGQQDTTRSQNNPTVDMFGRPLFHDSEKAIVADKAEGERRHDARTNMCEPASTARAFG